MQVVYLLEKFLLRADDTKGLSCDILKFLAVFKKFLSVF